MHILILFALVSFPLPAGKVVLNTGVPEAEFYLDATFVAAADQNGTLVIEDFPAGTFKYIIKKQGYKTYSDSFTIGDGEAKLLQPVIEKLKSPVEQDRRILRTAGGSMPGVKKQEKVFNSRPAAKDAPSIPVPKLPLNKSSVAQSAAEVAQGKSSESSALVALVFIIAAALLALGLWNWRRNRDTEEMQVPEAVCGIHDPEAPAGGLNRPEPPFIEELKRREEQLEAGFVASRTSHIEQESMKEKEVVIVLPKDAYRYEEDK
jgi:hypothetical protein